MVGGTLRMGAIPPMTGPLITAMRPMIGTTAVRSIMMMKTALKNRTTAPISRATTATTTAAAMVGGTGGTKIYLVYRFWSQHVCVSAVYFTVVASAGRRRIFSRSSRTRLASRWYVPTCS